MTKKFYPDYIDYQDSKEDIIKALQKINEQYPAVFRNFFYSSLEEVRKQKLENFSPYSNDPRIQQVSEEDMKYLSGTPVPLTITIPIVIEDDRHPMWKRYGYSSEEEFEAYFKTKPKDEPFR